MRRVVATTLRGTILTLLTMGAAMGACTPDPVGATDGGSVDSSVNPSGDAASDALRDTAVDAAAPGDAGPDANLDAADAADAATGPFTARTLADIPGLADFDFTDTTLAIRVAGQPLSTCPLAGCTTLTPAGTTTGHRGFSIAGNRLYFVAAPPLSLQDNVFSVAFDGTDLQNRTNQVVPGAISESALVSSSLGGGLTRVEHVVHWAHSGMAGYRTLVEVTSGTSGNPHRVGRTTKETHENSGSVVRYFPEQLRFPTETNPGALMPPEMTVTGSAVPTPATNPTAIATSARGVAVAHPAVVMLEGGTLKACPTSGICAAWIDLGALGGVFALDGQSLYVGNANGLGKCALEEIEMRGTCTLSPMGRDLVEAPMYVTRNEVFFKSGTRIRAVPTSSGVTCAPGSGVLPSGACAPCAAGEESASSRCRTCPRGTYAAAGAATCTPCADDSSTGSAAGTSVASCVACAPGEIANAATGHLCVDPAMRRVFLTAERHNGGFGLDPTLAGATAIAKADAFCMASVTKPATGTFKAMLVDGVLRDAVSRTDWVFLPSKPYFRVDGVTPIGTTTAAALLPIPLTNSWDGTNVDALFWTGVSSTSWVTSPTATCSGWMADTADPHGGRVGIAGRTDGSGIGVTGASFCQSSAALLCVEQ